MAATMTITAYEYQNSGYYPQYLFTPYTVVSNIGDLSYKNDIRYVYFLYQEDYGTPVDIMWIPFTYSSTNNKIETSLGEFEFVNYKFHSYHFIVQFYRYQDRDRDNSFLGALTADLSAARGMLGAFDYTISSTIPQFLLMNNNQYATVRVKENLSAEHPGTILRKGYYDSLVDWYVTCPDGRERTAADAVSAKYIKSQSVVDAPVFGAVGLYTECVMQSEFRFIPLVEGKYSVRCKMTYGTNMLPEYSTPVKWHIITETIWSTKESFIAHSPSIPVLELKSVEPEEYKYDELDDPLRGMPPYTAVWKDTSAENNPYQIPQRYITWEFGEEDSGAANMASQSNQTDELIIPDPQTHIYSGYGPYTCKMTVIDKLGNEKTATATFTPSTEPRMIKLPTATPLSGVQPLLVEGHGYVAGRPEPTVEWEFELLNATEEEYYSGEKEGKYVELSLLEAGTYSLTSRVVDVSGVTITEVEFDIEVSEAPIYDNNPVAMNNFDVWVYQNGERVGILQPASHAKYVDRYAHEKAVTFQVPSDYEYLQCLRIDNEFDFGHLGEARRMVVVSFEESEDGTYVTVSGKDYASYIFGYRVATVATQSTSGNGKDTQRHSGETLMRYFAQANLNTNNREVPRFRVLGRSANRGGTCVYSARYDKIADIIDSLCTMSGLGWDVSLQATENESIGWRVIEGVDRTFTNGGDGAVIFSARVDGLRNADVGTYSEYSSPNLAIGAGMGDGATREYTEYGETESTGLSRREVFVDAGDKAVLDEVELTCLAKLKDLEDRSIYVYPHKECPWVFGVDYKVGDYVSLETKSGIMMDMQIVSAELSNYAGEGEVLLLKCGVDERSTRTILRELELGNIYSKK